MYTIFWATDFLKDIREGKLAPADRANYLTCERGLGMTNLMPYTPEEMARMKRQQELKQETQHTLTYQDAKKFVTNARLPPLTYENLMLLLATYAKFLEMLFVPQKVGVAYNRNSHLDGVNAVRMQIFANAGEKEKMPMLYWAMIAWKVIDDQCKHFSECMSMQALGTKGALVWPRTDLHDFANFTMRSGQEFSLMTFP